MSYHLGTNRSGVMSKFITVVNLVHVQNRHYFSRIISLSIASFWCSVHASRSRNVKPVEVFSGRTPDFIYWGCIYHSTFLFCSLSYSQKLEKMR